MQAGEMLVFLEEWHLGDGLPAPEVGGVSNLAVVAESTRWLAVDSLAARPADRAGGPADPGATPDVVGTVVWRPADHPQQARKPVGPVEFGFVVRCADGLVLARSGRSRAGTGLDARWSRDTPPTPPVGSLVVLPAAALTVDPGPLWGDLDDLDGDAPDGWIDYRVDRIRPCGVGPDGESKVVSADVQVAVSDPDYRINGFLLDLTAVALPGDRA